MLQSYRLLRGIPAPSNMTAPAKDIPFHGPWQQKTTATRLWCQGSTLQTQQVFSSLPLLPIFSGRGWRSRSSNYWTYLKLINSGIDAIVFIVPTSGLRRRKTCQLFGVIFCSQVNVLPMGNSHPSVKQSSCLNRSRLTSSALSQVPGFCLRNPPSVAAAARPLAGRVPARYRWLCLHWGCHLPYTHLVKALEASSIIVLGYKVTSLLP